MTIKTVTYGQDTLIMGRGATELKAWKIAEETSARRKAPHNVYFREGGDFRRVSCVDGRRMGHAYGCGGWWWSAAMTVRDRAEKLAKTA